MLNKADMQTLRWTNDQVDLLLEQGMPKKFCKKKPILTKRLCIPSSYQLSDNQLNIGWPQLLLLFGIGAIGFFGTLTYFEIPWL